MSNPRLTAIIVGALFWISNVVTLVGSVITGPVPGAHDALINMYPHRIAQVIGTLIAHLNDAAIIGYAVALFPVLRRFSDSLALGYVAFKVVEATMLVVSAAAYLSLIPLSQAYTAAGGSESSSFQASAELTLAQQFWTARWAALAYLVATPILNFALYQTQLVPRFIAVWGLVAVGLLALGLALAIPDPTHGFNPGQLLLIPIILWELFFATWLIVRGFNPTALAQLSTRT